MKIIKEQSGGQLPFIDYIPIMPQNNSGQGAQTRASSSDKKSENLLEKAALKAVEENGLDVDVAIFAEYATQLMQSNALGMGDFTSTVSQLMKLRKVANQLRISKKLYDKAIDHTRTNNTGDDFAMTSDGKIYVAKVDGDKISLDTVKLETLAENQENYQPLTNNQLLDIRNNGHYNNIPLKENIAFNESILRDVNTSIGMQDVLTNITNIISKFGRRKSESYPNLSQSVANGMEYLYKVSTEYSNAFQDVTEDGETKKDVSAAIRYILTGLNNNAKNTLRLHAELNGTTVENFIKDAIVFNTDVSYSEDLEKAPKGKGSGSGSDGLKTTQSWANMVMEDNGRVANFKTIVNKSTLAFNFPGYIYDGISTKDDKSLESITNASDTFMNLANQGLTDSSKKVYFGNIVVDIASMGKDILVDNTRGGSVRYLPVDDSGNLSFSMMQQMADIQNQIVEKRITDKTQIKKIWEDAGFLYSSKMNTGVPKGMRLARFWVQDGYTNENTATFNDPFWFAASPLNGNQFFEKVDNTTVNQMIANYNSAQEKAGKVGFDIGTVKGWYTDSYRGSIFIPINEDQKQALVLSDKGYIEKPDYDRIKADQDRDRITSQWQTSASDLD